MVMTVTTLLGHDLMRCLQKKYPKDLPSIAVVLIYLDEALSIIKRAIRSIIDRTPEHLLREIILVDDHSSNGTSHQTILTAFV
jgi:hypothetical protein